MTASIENVLLTGGSGLVGKTLAPLLTSNYQVTHFDVRDPGDGLPFVAGDLRDSQKVAAACEGMDAVVHVAALHGTAWSEAGDDTGFEVNVVGTKNVLEGAAEAGARRVVFTSSIYATGHGTNPPYLPIDEELPRQPVELYGLAKARGEKICEYTTIKYGISSIVLRPGGSRPVESYGPDQVGYLGGSVDVRDVAQAHLLALAAPAQLRHGVFVATADSPLCQLDPKAYRADPPGALEKVVPGVSRLVEAGRLQLSPELEWYSIDKAKRLLGYRPRYNFGISQ